MAYDELPVAEAYRLLNGGGLIWVCTRSADGRYDLAPVAWNCPLDYDPVSRLLFVLDPGHRSFENLEASREFAVALPDYTQKELVLKTGSISGRETDKYASFAISARRAEKVDALIPEGAAAHLECRLLEVLRIGSVALVAGEVLAARSVADPWRRLLHHAGGDLFYRSGEPV